MSLALSLAPTCWLAAKQAFLFLVGLPLCRIRDHEQLQFLRRLPELQGTGCDVDKGQVFSKYYTNKLIG